jgi:hypothetical protein
MMLSNGRRLKAVTTAPSAASKDRETWGLSTVEGFMAVVWERSGEAFYADVEAADGTRYYLIVERLPAGEWDWSVWRQGNDWRGAHSGTGRTAQEAMRQAEEATT